MIGREEESVREGKRVGGGEIEGGVGGKEWIGETGIGVYGREG